MISNEFIYNELKSIQTDIDILNTETASIAKDIDKIDTAILMIKVSNVFNKIESLCALLNYSQIESNDYYYNYIVPFFKDYGLIHTQLYGIIKMFDEDYCYEENKYCEFNVVLQSFDDEYVTELNKAREEVGLVLTTKVRPEIIGKWISVDKRMPENNVNVIVCGFKDFNGGRIVMEAQYSEIIKSFTNATVTLDAFGMISPVTHWMPLPKPPQN